MDALPPTGNPFHGEGPYWKRNLLLGVLVFVFVGGVLSYFFRDQMWTPTSQPRSPMVFADPSSDLYGSSEPFEPSTDAPADFSVEASTVQGYMTYIDHYFGYKVDYPNTWLLQPSYDYTAFSSDYEGMDDALLENFNIGIEDLSIYSSSLTLDEYGTAALDQLLSEPAYTYVASGTEAMGPFEGRTYTGLYDFGTGEHAGVKSFFTLQNGNAYVLTYMYELPEKEVHAKLMEHVLESFELLPGFSPSGKQESDSELRSGDLGFTSLLHLHRENTSSNRP